MRRSIAGFLFTSTLAVSFFGCSGGSGPTSGSFGAACLGVGELCIVRCNLGCSTTTGCSVNEIAVNQPIRFEFSQPIDPKSVTTASFSLRSSRGVEPRGDFVVQGSMVLFTPSVETRNGQNFFGFDRDEVYTLELQGGDQATSPIRSVRGDILPNPLRCQLTANRGVVDLDGKIPSGKLVVPAASSGVAEDTLVVLEFSEVINTATFIGGGTGGGIFYKVALTDPVSGQCSRRVFPLPGVVSLNVDQVNNRTRVIFRPSLLLPSDACILVNITPQIVDLSGKAAKPVTFEFRVRKRPVLDQFVEEKFVSSAKRDKALTGAAWGRGKLVAGRLGGSGVLGDFAATAGMDINQKDAAGRDIYVWDTDKQLIPGTRTRSGKDITVTNGVFEFGRFVLGAKERMRIVGTQPMHIVVGGEARIDGVIEVVVPKPPKKGLDPLRGVPGGKGGPGGAAGGQGGDQPKAKGGSVTGRNGGDVVVPQGHPRAAQAAGTGGRGSVANPKSGKDVDVRWIKSFGAKIFVRMTASGGGGGSLWDTGSGALLGTGGLVRKLKPKKPQFPYLSTDFGEPSKGGIAFPVLPVVGTKASRDLFLIGGAGGGGSGAHTLYSQVAPRIDWTAGAGGAGGGGVLHIVTGGDFSLTRDAALEVRGGGGKDLDRSDNGLQPGARAPGGPGSGGSVLIQAGGVATLAGTVDVSGGGKGTMAENANGQLAEIATDSGKGGAGYLRVETDPPTNHTNFAKVIPPATAGNSGTLRSTDDAPRSVATSLWYNTRSLFPPTFLRYVIKAKIDGKDVVYSDDAKLGKRAVDGEPVEFYIQSAAVDPQTSNVVGPLTDWVAGTVLGLNAAKFVGKTGNGFRFMIVFNKDAGNVKTIEISSLRVLFRG